MNSWPDRKRLLEMRRAAVEWAAPMRLAYRLTMGYATSLIGLARNLGAGIGISVFTAFEAHREQLHQLRLGAATAQEPAHMLAQVEAYLRPFTGSSAGAAHRAMALLYRQLLKHAAALSYLDGFRVMALLMFATIPFVWIMKKPVYHSTEQPRMAEENSVSSAGPGRRLSSRPRPRR